MYNINNISNSFLDFAEKQANTDQIIQDLISFNTLYIKNRSIKSLILSKRITIEDKLRALYQLQCVDSDIDNIRIVRGELPLEIQDLEDDVTGLKTRIDNLKEELERLIANPLIIDEHKNRSIEWIKKNHDVKNVGTLLYENYNTILNA